MFSHQLRTNSKHNLKQNIKGLEGEDKHLSQSLKNKPIIGFKLDEILKINLQQQCKLNKQNKLNKHINIFKVSQMKRFNVVKSECANEKKIDDSAKYDRKFIKNDNYQQQNINNFSSSNAKLTKLSSNSQQTSQLLKYNTDNSTIYDNNKKSQKYLKQEIPLSTRNCFQIQKQINQKIPPKSDKVHLQSKQIKSFKMGQIGKIKQNNQEAKKYLEINISRYRFNELKSLHQAILLYANGDLQKLKKGLINVLNVSGILIQEDSLDLICQKFYHRNQTIQESWSDSRNKIKRHQNFDRRGLMKVCKQNIGSNQSKKEPERLRFQFIESFQKFIKLYQMLQNHYFKQSIIDYLEIILGSCVMSKMKQLNIEASTKLDKSIPRMNIKINQNDIYESFRKRYNQIDTINIVSLIGEKIHFYYEKYIKLHNSSSLTPSNIKTNSPSNLKYSSEKMWQITLGKLQHLFYSDNQLCHHLYECCLRELKDNKESDKNDIKGKRGKKDKGQKGLRHQFED